MCVCVLLRKFSTSQPKHCQRPRPFGMTDGKTGHASFTANTGTETDRQRSRSSITDTEATPPSLAPTATPPRDSFLELSVKKFSIIIIFFYDGRESFLSLTVCFCHFLLPLVDETDDRRRISAPLALATAFVSAIERSDRSLEQK